MAIKGKFNLDAIFQELEVRLHPIIIQAVTEAFEMACLEVVKQAKSLDTYQDQTNQLRSSIGYQIYNQGVLVTDYFQADGKGDGSGSSQGVARGKMVAAEAAREYSNDVVGVIVAGADYALYVESKGYDVISGPASRLTEIASKYLQIAIDGIREGSANG